MRAKRDIVRDTIHFVGRISLISPPSRLIRCRHLIDRLKFFLFVARRPRAPKVDRSLPITDPLILVNMYYAEQSE